MLSTCRISRPVARGLACALLASPFATGTATRALADEPPARDAPRTSSLAGTTSTPRQDLRMPDTRDAAEGRGTFNAPLVTVVKLPQRQPAPAADGGIDWADAGIGAGGLLGTLVLVLAGTAVVTRRRAPRAAIVG